MKTMHVLMLCGAIVLAGVAIGVAQQTSPAAINGCIVSATPLTTLTTGQQTTFICDTAGRLRVSTY